MPIACVDCVMAAGFFDIDIDAKTEEGTPDALYKEVPLEGIGLYSKPVDDATNGMPSPTKEFQPPILMLTEPEPQLQKLMAWYEAFQLFESGNPRT